MNIIWFKRDLRLYDHEALFKAAQDGPFIPLYILEPDLWKQKDLSGRQYDFLVESLRDLQDAFQKYGKNLIIKIGDAVEIFNTINDQFNITNIYSHQETWNDWTYKRDLNVQEWCKKNNTTWKEFVQHGVIRGAKNRDNWAFLWHKLMYQKVFHIPNLENALNIESDTLPKSNDLGIKHDPCPKRQLGGRRKGLIYLKSFLYERGENYRTSMSSPNKAYAECSRISPYLSFGCLSMREVFQSLEKRRKDMNLDPSLSTDLWKKSLSSFSSRLRWHCHFIQKLETQPSIEFEPMHSAYKKINHKNLNDDFFKAWKNGETGFPLIDACMRALKATGWINFRMRAMLVSFASHHLGIHWKNSALHLAKLFVDYEPGIHYAQIQMQSGLTGINTLRIYNPHKQAIDQDPEGLFIKRWIPELKDMPQSNIHTPWKIPSLLNGYAVPIIDEKIARKTAMDRLYAFRKSVEHKNASQEVLQKHTFRKKKATKKTVNNTTIVQKELF